MVREIAINDYHDCQSRPTSIRLSRELNEDSRKRKLNERNPSLSRTNAELNTFSLHKRLQPTWRP